MKMYEAINVKLTNEERELLLKADTIINDMIDVIETIPHEEGKELILPPVIRRLWEDLMTLNLKESSLKSESNNIKSYPR